MESLKNLKLYKYLKRSHAESLINEGKIRIGTYYEFIEMEHDKQRGDSNEGKMAYIHTVDKDTDVKELPIWPNNLKIEGNGKLIIQKGGQVKISRDSSDNYLFCCSKVYDENLMNDFGADCCIEIFDAENFSQKLFDKLVEAGYIYNHGTSGDCIYSGHDVDLTFKGTAHFLKDIEYKHQVEYRFVFPPILRDIEGNILESILYKDNDGTTKFRVPNATNFPLPQLKPIIIECKEAARFCRII